jgi:hypothetical protein
VAVKRDDEREAMLLAGVGNRLADDLLMAEMHAVKHADGEADFATAGLQLRWGTNEFHRVTG